MIDYEKRHLAREKFVEAFKHEAKLLSKAFEKVNETYLAKCLSIWSWRQRFEL